MGKCTIMFSDPVEERIRRYLLEKVGLKYIGHIASFVETCVVYVMDKMANDRAFEEEIWRRTVEDVRSRLARRGKRIVKE